MSELSDQKQLRETIIAHSIADTWKDAKKEWRLVYIYDEESNCICGHFIVENCVIYNGSTDATLIVGNVCINHFNEPMLTVKSTARVCLAALNKGTRTVANADLLDVAKRTRVLSTNETQYYLKLTTGKNSRTRFDPQHEYYNHGAVQFRDKINTLIKLGFSSARPHCNCGKPAKPRQNSKNLSYFYSCADGGFVNNEWKDCKFSQTVQ
jgi:hypothetical protein